MTPSQPILASGSSPPGPSRPQARISSPPSHPPHSPPPYRSSRKSIFSRLRRHPGPNTSSEIARLANKDIAKPPGKSKWDRRASRKVLQPPLISLADEGGVQQIREEDRLINELGWERIKTLPRVRLIPPEEGRSRRFSEIMDV